jgi:hypothetical protein
MIGLNSVWRFAPLSGDRRIEETTADNALNRKQCIYYCLA